MNKKNIILTVALLLLMPFTSLLNAKGSSSFSSSRSSSSSFSSGRSSSGGFSSNRSSGFSSSSKPTGGFSSSSSNKPSPSKSWFGGSSSKNSFDHSQQRANLTPFKPKEQYVSEFKAQNAAKYPTTFSAPPPVRPTYIPETTVYGNQQRLIQYNNDNHAYGFFDGLGKFIVYDAITHMATDSFHRDSAAHAQVQQAVYNSDDDDGMSCGTIFLWFVFVLFIIFILVLFSL